jgi:hypothetical protein
MWLACQWFRQHSACNSRQLLTAVSSCQHTGGNCRCGVGAVSKWLIHTAYVVAWPGRRHGAAGVPTSARCLRLAGRHVDMLAHLLAADAHVLGHAPKAGQLQHQLRCRPQWMPARRSRPASSGVSSRAAARAGNCPLVPLKMQFDAWRSVVHERGVAGLSPGWQEEDQAHKHANLTAQGQPSHQPPRPNCGPGSEVAATLLAPAPPPGAASPENAGTFAANVFQFKRSQGEAASMAAPNRWHRQRGRSSWAVSQEQLLIDQPMASC